MISIDKIRLILADPDNRYVDKLADYLSSQYSTRFKVSSYTCPEVLNDFIKATEERIDILLVSPEFLYHDSSIYKGIGMVAALTGSGGVQKDSFIFISKYQPVERLISQLLDLYTDRNQFAPVLVSGECDTRIVCVYSPAGGSGKTSVTLGLAGKLSDMGYGVLCLSLESINSLAAGLHTTGNDAMTRLLLSLSENAAKLPVKFEVYKTRDTYHDVDFVEPPECFLELAEVTGDDIRVFLATLKQMCKYDFVLLDMDSALDSKALTALTVSDKVVLVDNPDEICGYKMRIFLEQLTQAGFDEQTGFFKKAIVVINKVSEGIPVEYGCGLKADLFLPLVQGLWKVHGGKYRFDSSRALVGRMDGLANKVANR